MGCELWDNGRCGLAVTCGGDATLTGCLVRNHPGGYEGRRRGAGRRKGGGCGVFVHAEAAGAVTVDADCVFMHNVGGGVVREAAPTEAA